MASPGAGQSSLSLIMRNGAGSCCGTGPARNVGCFGSDGVSAAGAGPQAFRWAAAVAVELGDMKKAHDYLSALRAIYPDDPYAVKMQRYLSGDGGEYPFPDYSIVFQGTGR